MSPPPCSGHTWPALTVWLWSRLDRYRDGWEAFAGDGHLARSGHVDAGPVDPETPAPSIENSIQRRLARPQERRGRVGGQQATALSTAHARSVTHFDGWPCCSKS